MSLVLAIPDNFVVSHDQKCYLLLLFSTVKLLYLAADRKQPVQDL